MKIEIKNKVTGKVIFEFEAENNSIKKTVIEAVKRGADLTFADLRGADLGEADLKGAQLDGADLTGAYLSRANLSEATLTESYIGGADLTHANLNKVAFRGAYLKGSDLRGSDLRGSDLTGVYLAGAIIWGADLKGAGIRASGGEKIKIKKAALFNGLYRYAVMPIIDQNNVQWVNLGCHMRKLSDWEKDFWNNTSAFLNKNTKESKARLFAFDTAKRWLTLNKVANKKKKP